MKNKNLNLSPLTFEEAMKALLKTKPEPTEKKVSQSLPKSSKPISKEAKAKQKPPRKKAA